jgi:hypothetical protein
MHKDLKKYQTCIVPEFVVVERKNLVCTHAVALPTPLTSASPLYAALSPPAVNFPFDFPVGSPENSKWSGNTLPHSKHHCFNNAIQHAEPAMFLPSPA